jgi:hypothetical protein
MKSPGLLTMLMVLSVAMLATAGNQPRAGQRDSSGLFARKSAKAACPAGMRYSSFYAECVHGWTFASSR